MVVGGIYFFHFRFKSYDEKRTESNLLCLLRLCLLLGAAAAFGREDILGVTKGALEEEQPASRRRRRRRIPPRKGEKKTKKKH